MTDVSAPGAPPPQGARSGWLKYALIASLALNLLILGAVAGSMYHFGRHRPFFGGRGEDFGLMGLSRHLSEERRKEIRKRLKDDREALRPLVDEVRAARRAAADRLAAEPFDKAALESAITAAAEKERVLRQAAVTAFLTHAEWLKADERRLLADWWRKRSEPFKPRRGKKAGDAETKSDAEAKSDAAAPPAN